MPTKDATRTEAVYDELRADLLNGTFEPGQRLKLATLGERFGTSLSVIREALTRLTEQQLVVAMPQRGFSVRTLSVEDLTALTDVRVRIESMALEQAIARGDMAYETSVVASYHRLERTPVSTPEQRVNEEWSAAHRAFHQSLLAGCGNRWLEAIAVSLRDNAELYRRWSWSLGEDSVRDIAAEHLQLKELTLARDSEAAVAALAEHIQRSSAVLIQYVTKSPSSPAAVAD